jgi:signal transduction histidine kinase
VVVLLAGWFSTDQVGLTGPLWTVLGGPWILIHAVVAVALLLTRRTHPIVPAALTSVGALIGTLGSATPSYAGLAATVYACTVYRSPRSGIVAAVTGTAVFGVARSIDFGPTIAAYPDALDAIAAVAALVVPVAGLAAIALLLGISIRNRRRYLAALIDRAEQLTRDRDQEARLAVIAERARIARELHDVVAHSLSVMVRLSDGAAAVATTDPARAAEAVRHIGRVGRESLVDMRRLLGVLHDEEDPSSLAPQPSIEDIGTVLETARAAGLPIAFDIADARGLDAATQLIAFRVLQEGVTNALRYADAPTRVLVRMQVGDVLELEVSDDGRSTGHRSSLGAGRGLVGIRERAVLYGGVVEAGPRQELGGRGWRLRVQLPLGAPNEKKEPG